MNVLFPVRRLSLVPAKVRLPVPVNGPVGDLLRLQGRHNLRPAHIHFLIAKAGFKTQFAQVYSWFATCGTPQAGC